jgi:DNA-binding CsgD family transcriptional regulator
MDQDLKSPVGGHGVWSLYYDTPRLRFYREKIEGLKFRRKLRIRHYGNLDGVTDESPVCVEVKQRVNKVTQKRRITLPYGVARQLCDGRQMIEPSPRESAFVQEALELVVGLNLHPLAVTALLDPEVTRRLVGKYAARIRPADDTPPDVPLTPRELEVLYLIANGLSNSEIATALVISPETVKTFVSRILTKLNLRDRVQAVVYAYRRGLVT